VPCSSGAQILVGGRHYPHIDMAGDVAAQSLELALLQHPQQSHVYGGGHIADFVEKYGSRVGLFELAGLGSHGAREGALLVAKQFARYRV
jgi:hypothetical protein